MPSGVDSFTSTRIGASAGSPTSSAACSAAALISLASKKTRLNVSGVTVTLAMAG